MYKQLTCLVYITYFPENHRKGICITLKIDLTFFQEVYQEIFFIQKTNFCVLRWFYPYKGQKFSKDIFYPAVTSPKHEHEIVLEIDQIS